MVNEAKTRIGKFKKTGSKISRIIVGTTLPNLMMNMGLNKRKELTS